MATEDHLPPVAERLTMLRNAAAQMREQGYMARINLIVLEAQDAPAAEKAARGKALGEQAENARKAVVRLEEEIAALGDDGDA